MERHTTTRPLFIVAMAVVLTLTGCATDSPRPVPSSYAPTRSSTPTPSAQVSAGPAVVRPPTSKLEAIADANRSLLGYYTASFTSGHAGGTRLDLVTLWVTSSALKNEQLLADYLKQKNYRLDGTPTRWSLNESRSSTAQTTEANGLATVPYGAVRLVGCAKSTNYPVGDGAPPWTSKGQQFARTWSVLYDVERHQWLVAAAIPVEAEESASTCG